MRNAPLAPRVHLFVCANQREENSPLGPGCSARGEAVYAILKDEVARQALTRAIWVTKTHCLGICPKRGCTVAIYPNQKIVSDVAVEDATALLTDAMNSSP